MATHEITCATKTHPHRHITHVGTSSGLKWTVTEARQRLANGDVLYTAYNGKVALVNRYTCPSPCGYLTLRSAADAVPQNNLDNLPNC